MITLRQFRYLSALAQHRHFGRAAEACAVTPAGAVDADPRSRERARRRTGRAAAGRRRAHRDRRAMSAQRAERILAAARDLVDFARHRGRLLSGRSAARHHPDLGALSCCRNCCRMLQRRYPRSADRSCARPRPRRCSKSLSRGDLDVVMLALPVDDAEIESVRLFDDPFLLAVPADDPLPRRRRVDAARHRPAPADPAGRRPLPARSGARLLRAARARHAAEPRRHVACDGDADGRQRLRRHAGAAKSRPTSKCATSASSCCASPRRSRAAPIGLAWRRTSPRKADFVALGEAREGTLGIEVTPDGSRSRCPELWITSPISRSQLSTSLQAVIAGRGGVTTLAPHPVVQDAADVLARDAGHRGEVALADLLPDDDAAAADVLAEGIREVEQRARDAALERQEASAPTSRRCRAGARPSASTRCL